MNEVGIDDKTGKTLVKVDPVSCQLFIVSSTDLLQMYFRPAEVDLLLGSPAKAEKVLGWKRKARQTKCST